MKTLIGFIAIWLVYSQVFTFGQVGTVKFNIHFASNSSKLNNEDKKFLLSKLIEVSKHQVEKISITGHTDQIGSSSSNVKLAQNRINEVSKVIVDYGVLGKYIEPINKGESDLLLKDYSHSSLMQNRRVEVLITYIPKSIVSKAEKINQSGLNHDDSLLWLLDQLKAPYQVFEIDNDRDTVIFGEQGTVVGISANSFDMLGSKNNKVQFKLKEVYKNADFVLENLYTMSDNKLLASQGMIETRAYVNGVEVDLKKGSRIKVSMPADSINPNSQLFSGKRNNKNHGVSNWTALNQADFRGLSFRDFNNCICCYSTNTRMMYRTSDAKYLVTKCKYKIEKLRHPFYAFNSHAFLYLVQKELRNKKLTKSYVAITRILNKNYSYRNWVNYPSYQMVNSKVNKFEFKMCPDCSYMSDILSAIKPITLNDLLNRQKELADSLGAQDSEELFNILMKKAEEKMIKNAKLASYTFTQEQLGWRNIDYFYHLSNEKKVNVVANADNPNFKGVCQLMFDKIKVQVAANWNGESYQSDKVGEDYSVAIICIDIIDGKPAFGLKKTKSSEKQETIEILPSSVPYIKKAVQAALN